MLYSTVVADKSMPFKVLPLSLFACSLHNVNGPFRFTNISTTTATTTTTATDRQANKQKRTTRARTSELKDKERKGESKVERIKIADDLL